MTLELISGEAWRRESSQPWCPGSEGVVLTWVWPIYSGTGKTRKRQGTLDCLKDFFSFSFFQLYIFKAIQHDSLYFFKRQNGSSCNTNPSHTFPKKLNWGEPFQTYQARIILIPKPEKGPARKKIQTKDPTRKELQTLRALMQKSSTKYYQTESSSIIKGLYFTTKWYLFLEYKDGSTCEMDQCNIPH